MLVKSCFSLLLILIFHISPIYSDDDPDQYDFQEEVEAEEKEHKIHKATCVKVANKDVPDSNLALETLEGGPSAIVEGCVNAITGHFFDSYTPVTIPGVVPLTVQCTYCSAEKEWNFQHMPKLVVGQSNGKNHLYARYQGDNGSGITYRAHVDEGSPGGLKERELTVPQALFDKGLTNCSSGMICGKTNWRNSNITPSHELDKGYKLAHGSGINRIFERYSGHSEDEISLGKFRLKSERHPNGNRLLYTYIENKLGSVKVQNKKGLPLGELAVIHPNDHSSKMQWGFLGNYADFTFEDNDHKRIKLIMPSNDLWVRYEYNRKTDRLEKKSFPDGHFLAINYYTEGENKGRVESLKKPRGTTHSFTYSDNQTCVTDAEKNFTIYRYDKKTKRLISIARGIDYFNPIAIDEFEWYSEGKNAGNLQKRIFRDGNQIIFTRMLNYDGFGNVTMDHLFGNLTGKSGKEPYTKTFRHSQDGRNLLLEENDQKKILCCDYHPNLLLKHRFTKDKGKILKREFFAYDDNGVLIEEIWDDGHIENKDDLSDVTERHIKQIAPRTESPIGYPQIVAEYYLDIAANEKVLLKKTVYEHNSLGKVEKEEHYGSDDVLAYTLTWKYDKFGNVKETTDALGRTTIYDYDENNNKILEEGPRPGWKKIFDYDKANNLKKETETWPDGTVLTLTHEYNLLNQRKSTTDTNECLTEFEYDALGRLKKTTGPTLFTCPGGTQRPVEKNDYDAMGNVVVHTDGNGHITKTDFTIRGQPYRIEYPDGTVEQKEYSLSGRLIKEIAKNGLITNYTYDPFDRITETCITDPEEKILKTKSSTYSTFQLLSETDEKGMVTIYKYDGAGRRISTTKGDHHTQYEYDPLGRVAKTIDSIDNVDVRVTCKEYDFLDQVIEERIEDGLGNIFKKEKYGYDEDGNKNSVTCFTQAGISQTVTDYHPNGKPSLVTDALGNKTRYFYRNGWNHRGQKTKVLEIIDPLGNMEHQIFDTHGNVCCRHKQDPFGKLIQLENIYYDCVGQKVHSIVTVFQGNEAQRNINTLWTYNSMGELTGCYEAAREPEQKIVIHRYNQYGEREFTDMPNGISIKHTYDIFGRLDTYQSSDHTIYYRYTYDKKDNPKLIEDLVHGTATKRIYDDYGRIESETLDNGLTTTYTYDQLDRPLTVTFPDQSSIRYHYNAHQLIAVERIKDNEVVYTHRYDEYDLADNVTQETLLGQAGTIQTQYDLLQRSVAVQAPHWQENIPQGGFDAVGNLKERAVIDPQGKLTYTYTYDLLHQLISETGCVSHTYQNDSVYNRSAKDKNPYKLNSLNQLLSQTNSIYRYDANGNLKEKTADKHTTRYIYDPLDRLIEVHDGSDVTTYTYDSFHRRLSKTQNGMTTCYLYQNDNEIGAFNEGKITQLRVLGISYGAEIGGAIALEFDGKTYVPIHDPLGNIVALLDLSGKLIENYRYSAFGEIQIFSEAEVDNPWRYSSKRFDAETGFIFFGRRYYDPEIGRWITPDPAGFADGPNLYAYVHNHPLAYIDPDGQFAQFLVAMAVSFAIDMAIDATLPFAVAFAEPYIGVASTSFLAGVVRGRNSDFTPKNWYEAGGMCVGATIGMRKHILKKLFANTADIAVETLQKGAINAAANAAAKTSERVIVSQVKNQTAHKAKQLVGILKPEHLEKTVSKVDLDILSKFGLKDGMKCSTKQALETGEKFLGKGYKEVISGSGRYVSADGKRIFRMGVNDIMGKHGGGPHVNFETLIQSPVMPNKMIIDKKMHIYLID
jgi:RHS repeat-associated protein